MHNDETNEQDQDDPQIRALLKDYPMPQAEAGFYDHALARATHEGSIRQRNRWLMTGFGSAVAAGLAIWVIGGMLMTAPQLPDTNATIPGVTVTLAEPQTVNLMFSSATALASATLTVP